VEQAQPGLAEALDGLVEPETRGDPECPLRWTTKSLRKLSDDLALRGFTVSLPTVGQMLAASGYSLQAPVKTKEGADHPGRDAQFRYIAAMVTQFRAAGEPVISVDTKKKEPIGEFSPGGREWRPAGQPLEVNTDDFPDKELGKAVPYGIHDVAENTGWVSVGRSADTAEFAVQAIRTWWHRMGKSPYPNATKLLITADGGGSNGYRVRLWKAELAALALELGLDITVVHFPRGTLQVEQDRTPPLQSHHDELARSTPGKPRGRGEPHRRNHHPYRPDRACRTRPRRLPERHQGNRRGVQEYPAGAARLPRRLELHDPKVSGKARHARRVSNLFTGPCRPKPN
jgi:Rhodopirellula transposase DDE domain